MPDSQDALQAAIDRSLERGREPSIPADFAARVSAFLPPAPLPRRAFSLRRSTALIVGVLLLCAIFLLAAHSVPSFTSSAFDLELFLLAQLAAIAGWLAVEREA